MTQFDNNVDNLAKFGPTFQAKVLASILSSQEFLQQSLDVLNPNFFETDAGKWVVKETVRYFGDYKSLPTPEVFRIELDKERDDALKVSVKEQLRNAFQRKNDDDLEYVKDSFLDFAKNQALKSAIVRSVDLLQMGDYGNIKTLIDAAMKAGQPRNIGHNWKEDIAIRLSGVSRITVPTGWDVIDTLTGGGLGAGELGVIAAPSGIGKCVDGDTEIDIEYEEFSIELDGKEVWFAPWDTLTINGKEIRGWDLLSILKIAVS
jgi:hypothetical protein